MQLLTAPAPFSPAFGEILYAVSLTESEKGAEISIFNSAVTEKIGIKKATEAPDFTLNVADYVRSQIEITPLPVQASGLIAVPERIFNSCIAYQNWASTNPHTAGVVPVRPNQFLSDQPARSLGENEQDEICWIANPGTYQAKATFHAINGTESELSLGNLCFADPGMAALVTHAGDLESRLAGKGQKWTEQCTLNVELLFDNHKIAEIPYRIRPHRCRTTRLCWWNRYGGVDYHTFECQPESHAVIEKQQIHTGTRFLNQSSSRRSVATVSTPYTTRASAEWLVGLATAPQAWVIEGDAFTPIEITDRNITTHNETLSEIAFHFQHSLAVYAQTF